MSVFSEIIKGTPVWLYALFAYLIFIGIRASKPSVIKLRRLFVLPVIFALLNLYNLVQTFNLDLKAALFWFGALLIGLGINWYIHRNLLLQADKKKQLIK
ncbi:MAG: hypothetical protein KAR79_00955, partial [Simkaniaceae bacterium]|nr:hypothetical protein [Simkaniaceae bacterium]